MARIRSIKPQFWLDEDLATLPAFARLLYIGLWNFADDQGVFQYRPKRIKAQIFPYDDLDEEAIQGLLDSLESLGKFERFLVKGEEYGLLVNFLKHQKINRPSKYGFIDASLIPQPHSNNTHGTLTEPSLNAHATLSLGKRSREEEEEYGVGSREEEGDTNPALAAAAKAYEDNIGLLTGAIAESLTELVDEYPEGWITDAIKRAAEMEKRNLAYIQGILRGWKRDGRTTRNRQERWPDNPANQNPMSGPPRDPLATVVYLDSPGPNV